MKSRSVKERFPEDNLRYDAEDLEAPHGRCYECYRPFGMRAEDGFVVYRAYCVESSVCTECVEWERQTASRKYDDSHNRRRR